MMLANDFQALHIVVVCLQLLVAVLKLIWDPEEVGRTRKLSGVQEVRVALSQMRGPINP